MKTRTKLLTAVLSTVTALSCALTAAAAGTTPTITLQGNETKPAAAEDSTVTLSLKATEFSSVAGADLKLTLNGDISLDSVNVTITNNATNQNWELEKDSNYTVSGNTLKIVDVFNMTNAPQVTALDLSVALKFDGDVNIGRYAFTYDVTLVNDNEQIITPAGVTMGKLVIGKKSGTAETGTKKYDDNTKFLPYGVPTDSNGKYIDKNESGEFNFAGGESITCFIKPEGNDVTTFGASKIVDTNAIQFGSYVESVAAGAYFGTLVIVSYDLPTEITSQEKYKDATPGTLDDVLKYYKEQKGYKSNDEVFARLAQLLSSKKDGKFHPISYNNNSKIIYVSIVEQKNYMWRTFEGETLKQLQYAVRYKGLDDTQKSKEYTAVGYTLSGSEYNFSTELKTASFNGIQG